MKVEGMRIHKWEGRPMSAIIGQAIVEVDPGVAATVEDLARVVDGNGYNFGVHIRTLGPGQLDESATRLFHVTVNRD